jgi:uncharacterized protein related to proFAR isomerase
MHAFEIIPVLDIKGGMVVQARAGDRARYLPIESPLASAGEARVMAEALLAVTGSPILYVADLDAIEGRGDHRPLCHALAAALPDTELWVDAGANTPGMAETWLRAGITPVIGSESLSVSAELAWLCQLDPKIVLSLDFRETGFIGPGALLDNPGLWPARVIVMSLARVGGGAGPDLEHLKESAAKAGEQRLYAAGGIRDLSDLEALAGTGASGALVASTLHAQTLTPKEIAAFLRRRRSRS